MAWLCGANLALGCAHGTGTKALEQRVDRLETQSPQLVKLEQRMANLEAMVWRLEKLAKEIDADHDENEARGNADMRIYSLTQRLKSLEARLDSKLGAPSTRQPRRARPDPSEIYSVAVAGSPFIGPRDAKVTMIRASEFACPYCERSRATMKQLIQDYGSDLRIVYKHFVVHPQAATVPALAACAAQKQKHFFEMEKAIWERGYHNGRDLSQANMEAIARDLGLNMRKFRRDMKGAACTQQIQDDQAQLKAVGATGTPSFFINGRFISGARPVHMFKAVIDEELAKADQVMKAKNIKQRDYYDYIVNIGKKSLQN